MGFLVCEIMAFFGFMIPWGVWPRGRVASRIVVVGLMWPRVGLIKV